MPKIDDIISLDLVLTASCNLTCGYCYQNSKKRRTMDWDTLRAAIELGLRSRQSELDLVFYGGEPLLEFPLIRRAVALVDRRCPSRKQIQYHIITNGTLLDDEKRAFLAAHDFETQLSFDGVPDAQDVRGRGTFEVLDRTLDQLRAQFPSWFYQRLSICITVSSRTLPYLSRSFEYFLSKRVPTVGINPVFTHDAGWTADKIETLDEQFASIFAASERHYRKTGRIPMPEFRGSSSAPRESPRSAMCGAPFGRSLTVDVDGQLFGCASFADSFQKYSGSFLRDKLDSMRLGELSDDALGDRLEAYSDAARATHLFLEKEKKYSSYAKCGECEYLNTCLVCPTSIGHIPGNDDPHRVPDFQCAFNLVLNKYREKFQARDDLPDLFRGTLPIPDEMLALRRAVEAAELARRRA